MTSSESSDAGERPEPTAAAPAEQLTAILDADELAGIGAGVELPNDWTRTMTRERLAALAKPVGALGRLEDYAVWISSVQGVAPPRPFTRPRVVIFAGDHGIAREGVSAYPPEVTGLMVQAFLSGVAGVSALARQSGASVRVLDLSVDADLASDLVPHDLGRYKIRRGSGVIDREDALSLQEASDALRAGMAIADEEIDGGADLLIAGDMGIGNTTPAAAIVGVMTGTNAASVIGRGTGIDDRGWMRKCAAIRDAMRRARPVLGDPVALLSCIGGADLAAMTGFLLQASVRRTPVILDGVVSCACAVVAHDVAPRASDWWIAGHRSPEPSQKIALDRLALTPVLDMGMRLGEGTGALLALPILQAAAATCAEMATLAELGGSH